MVVEGNRPGGREGGMSRENGRLYAVCSTSRVPPVPKKDGRGRDIMVLVPDHAVEELVEVCRR